MAHFAILDENNIVLDVIVGIDENDTSELPSEYDNWEVCIKDRIGAYDVKRTSYNTQANVHSLGGTPFRGNYAVIGGTYDTVNDVFLYPKPYDSWTIDTDTWLWKPPVPKPTDDNRYEWNEQTQSWDIIS